MATIDSSVVKTACHLDVAASTPSAFQQQQYYNYQQDDDDDGSDDYYDDYEQQQIDYAELQRQDAEYEAQLEQQDVHLPNTHTSSLESSVSSSNGGGGLDASVTISTSGSSSSPIYYQGGGGGGGVTSFGRGASFSASTTGDHRRLPVALTLDAAATTPTTTTTTTTNSSSGRSGPPSMVEEAEVVRPRLSIISWADDADECSGLFRDRDVGGVSISTADDNDDDTRSDTDSPHDSDYFNLSSTSSSSPTKSTRSISGSGTSFGAQSQQFQTSLDQSESEGGLVEDESTISVENLSYGYFPTATTVTTYCSNYGSLGYHDYLDLEDQRSQLAEDKWRDSALWCERQAEMAKLSVANRKVAVKLLIDEAYRLDKKHVGEKFGSESAEAREVTRAWRKIGTAAVAEMEEQGGGTTGGSTVVDNHQQVIRKFSSMAIFIAGQGTRYYCENEEGKFNRLEAQAKVLDSLIFVGRLFCSPDEVAL